jgi:prepilin-type processing-associated H-X9-DG protein
MSDAETTKPPLDEPPLTFSLRTLFLLVTCVAIACAAFRIVGSEHGLVAAFAFIGVFLTCWFLVRGRWSAAVRTFSVLIIAFLVAMLVDMHDFGPRPASPGAACQNNLRNIGSALEAYRQKHGSFPPAFVADKTGKPLYSWRVLISPEMDRQALFNAFHLDEPWNGPNNAQFSGMHWDGWSCPSDEQVLSDVNYLAVVGPNTAWPGATGSKLSDFKDPSKTILVVEVANSGIHWAEPRDLYTGQMAPGVNPKSGQGVSSHHAGGFNAVFADGHIEFIPDDIDPKQLAEMFEINPQAGNSK